MSKKLYLVLTAIVPLAAIFGQGTDVPAYQWSATGPLQVARHGACAAALADGRIVVAGGVGVVGPLRSVEIYQPDGTFVSAADMLRGRAGHTCTALADGRVLVAGGLGDGQPVAAETFDPKANAWTAAVEGAERWNHTATLLPDGRVLLAGGQTADGVSDLLEWFNPATNRIRGAAAHLSAPRIFHAAALLSDGKVLVSGGWSGQSLLDSADLVAPDGAVEKAATLPAARAGHTATALDNGCVLIAGGLGVDGDLKSATLYCSESGEYRAAGEMSISRFTHLAFLLPNNGQVLIAGGYSQGGPTAASELYDPAANVFRPAGALTRARLGISGAADPVSGAVLAVGGYTDEGPIAGCGVLRGPSVIFDKVRYVDGDTVTVSGLGWKPGERVDLSVSTQTFAPPGTLSQIVVQKFQATASALGRIQQTLFVASPLRAGVLYRADATGAASLVTASGSARQVSRSLVTLSASPFPALTRQLVTLRAVVQPATSLDAIDGQVDFQTGGKALGSVNSNSQFIAVSSTGQITDGSSNTIQVGETPSSTTGFSRSFVAADGSVRSINGGGTFQLGTLDLPAGSNVLTASSSGSVTASYAAFSSLYAPNSASATVSVNKRTVNLNIASFATSSTPLKVGDPLIVTVSVTPTQQPQADVSPTGSLHLNPDAGNAIDAALSPAAFTRASRGTFNVLLPAGVRSFSAQYDGDDVYLPGAITGAGSVTIGKGVVGFALTAGKATYTVGEPIALSARLTHPRVPGATPTGQITRTLGPVQFQGAALAADSGNTGTIDTNLPVVGFPAPGNFTLTMTYGGDANFQRAGAGAIVTVVKAVPQVSLIPPAQIVAGQETTFTVRATAPSNLTFKPAVSGQITLTGVANGATANLVASSSSIGVLRQTFPTAGTFTVAVQYAGDANYQSAVSASAVVVVQ